MSRQNRRHPTHPLLPTLYPSKKRIVDPKCDKEHTVSKQRVQRRRGKI